MCFVRSPAVDRNRWHLCLGGPKMMISDEKNEVPESIQESSGNIPRCPGPSKIIYFKRENRYFMKSGKSIFGLKTSIFQRISSILKKSFSRLNHLLLFIYMVRKHSPPESALGGPFGQNRQVLLQAWRGPFLAPISIILGIPDPMEFRSQAIPR